MFHGIALIFIPSISSHSLFTSDLADTIKKPTQNTFQVGFSLSPLTGSNRRPTDYKSVALPAELRRHILKLNKDARTRFEPRPRISFKTERKYRAFFSLPQKLPQNKIKWS
jgi:hypothetical protein